MSGIPGQRAAQSPLRASVAVQRVLGRVAGDAGVYASEIGVTGRDGRRVVLALDGEGREMWTDETGARMPVWGPEDFYDDEDE